ncbi:uncharacterized protein LOC131857973 [Cryptomeria japonica]|uniref:uncharacterized protein LOC131857973 n=1 Tax=Cryptomeria japonica TaxID=3369 RepID=UPI0027DAB152|nr:uncharacterized protein LOC131857973 [Cryptomeria japonica]
MYSTKFNQYLAYSVSISDVNIRSGKTLQSPVTLVIIELTNEEEEKIEPSPVLQTEEPKNLNPPLPQTLAQPKSVLEPTFDFLGQLKKVSIKIPLCQAINDVTMYSKVIREACLKKLGRKKKDLAIVHVMGKLTNVMLGKLILPKYSDPGSPIVAIMINGIMVQNDLIDLGVAINVMTKEIMQNLNLANTRPTHIVIQLDDSSTFKLDGMIEDIVVTLDYWEYPGHFMVLSPKATLG